MKKKIVTILITAIVIASTGIGVVSNSNTVVKKTTTVETTAMARSSKGTRRATSAPVPGTINMPIGKKTRSLDVTKTYNQITDPLPVFDQDVAYAGTDHNRLTDSFNDNNGASYRVELIYNTVNNQSCMLNYSVSGPFQMANGIHAGSTMDEVRNIERPTLGEAALTCDSTCCKELTYNYNDRNKTNINITYTFRPSPRNFNVFVLEDVSVQRVQ